MSLKTEQAPSRAAAAGRSSGPTIAIVSTCPPRRCGLATFTAHLTAGIKVAAPELSIRWAAIDDGRSTQRYGSRVAWRIRQSDGASYRAAAEQLDAAVDVICIQHELGLYGTWNGKFEDHLEGFLAAISKPVVTTFHTMMPDPSPSILMAVRRAADRSRAIVVMTDVARKLLVERYGADRRRVHVIPHGVPTAPSGDREGAKARLGLGGHTIIFTFGFLDPRKGIEYMIRAMRTVVAHRPDALYVVAGVTHPELARREGHAYRRLLGSLVAELGLTRHVTFMDDYLTDQSVLDHLRASEVYVTPYLDPNQVGSGTLTYALGLGRALVSSPYLHAVEALSDGRGLLVDFRDAGQLADVVLRVLDSPDLRIRLERAARASPHWAPWKTVGAAVADLLRSVWAQERHDSELEGLGTLRAGIEREKRDSPAGVTL